MGKRWAFLVLALVAFLPISVAAAPAWEEWQAVAGVFDLGGPRADGSLVVAGSAALYTLTPDAVLAPFSRGPGGYRDDPGAEAYLAVSPGQHVIGAGCDFARDDIFILRLHAPLGITKVRSSGDEAGSFVNLGVTPNQIAFDTTGSFDHRLLVAGPVSGKTEVVAVDCNGGVQVITKTAPAGEGGSAVAPRTFGGFAGYLVLPDELSGIIWAVAPDGTARQVVDSGLPKGQDTGVESLGFVPSGFSTGGVVYYSDRATAGSPHPGSDKVLRLSSADLVAAGVQDGDLLAATEGGASMIDVRCATTCRAVTVVGTPTGVHGEGHLVFTLNRATSPSQAPHHPLPVDEGMTGLANEPANTYIRILAILAVVSVAGWLVFRRRRR